MPKQVRKKLRFLLTLQLLFVAISGAMAQGFSVRGKVSGDAGDALPGVTILLKGTTSNGTVTNADGQYELSVPDGKGSLIVSFIGYQNKEVPINNQRVINVTLAPDTKALQEVVVVGYGEQKKETVTGSVTSVKGAEVTKSPSINVTNSLAGRLPGLTAVGSSGEPGYDGARLRIRGVNTFGNADPLVVVDGVPGRSLERIDPNTIESISVLKDASAAIYGAQAANGVILVTTKRGKAGKPTITASFNQGYGRPTRLPDMANAAEYATMLNEIDQYAGNAPRFKPEDIQKFQDGSDPWGHPNTEWFKEVLKPWSGQNQGNVSVSGGSDNMKYFVSLTSRSQDGFYYNSGTKYNQYDFRSNLDGNITKNISLAVDLSGRMEDRNFPTRGAGSIFRSVMRGKPNMTAYWPDGTPGPDIEYGDNPVVISTKATGYDRDKRYVFNSNTKLNIIIPWVEGLSFTANAALDKNFRFNKTFYTPWYLYSWDGKTMDANGKPVLVKGKKGFEDPRLNQYMEDNQNILVNGLLNYNRTIAENHGFKFLIGVERITGKGDNFSAFRRNFISTAVDQLFAGSVDQYTTNNGSGFSNGRLNYFGRVNYDFKNKYLAEFVWRYQASYIFEQSSRFGFFPGVSLGYVVSEEEFWKEALAPVTYFKLRASYGQTGNDLIDPYQYLALFRNNNLAFVSNGGTSFNQALYEDVVPNQGVTWEKAIQRNVGFDANFLQDKLTVTADYFSNLRSNILWPRNAAIPMTAGFVPPRENIGKSGNRGFDFSVNYNNSLSELTYQVGLNGGYSKNRIIFWDENQNVPEYQFSTGRPIGSPLYYNAIGIFKDQAAVDAYPHWAGARPGDIIFEDVNGDKKIDANDRVRLEKSDIPTWTGGINLNLGYKGFDVTALVQGAAGAVRYNTTESGEIGNFLQSFYDNRWTPENPNASGPRTFNRSNEYWISQGNTYWLNKTDYVRLKNIELGYTLPAFTEKWNIQKARIYVNAFNLLTYSPDYKDFDPELSSGSGQGYPLQKIVNGGVSITF
jgi:TonB-dependent starch-binding outer membrane protein SusC